MIVLQLLRCFIMKTWLCKDGEAGKMIDEGHVELGGKVPVNVSEACFQKVIL